MRKARTRRADAASWLRAHPGRGAVDLHRELGVPLSTAYRWVEEIRAGAEPAPKKGTPAKLLTEEDRERVLVTVRDSYLVLQTTVARLRLEVEAADGVPRIDRDTAQALLNLQRMTAGLVEAHPGLMELAKQGEEQAATDDDVEAILEVLGVGGDAAG